MSDRGGWSITGPDKGEQHMPTSQRRRRLVTTTILAALTVGVLAAGSTVAGAASVRPLRSVSVQDPLDTGDAIAELRGDPVMGAYGYVAKQVNGAYQLTCRADASFDGTSYRVRFPVRCIGGPDRLRFTAYGQLYHDSGSGIIGGDYAPAWGEFSGWLALA